jgi:hypothetical protein
MRRAAVALLFVLAACGPSAGVMPSPSPAASPVLGSPPAGAMAWPAISVEDTDTFGIDISGTGTGVAKVDIRSRFGAVKLGGRVISALVYQKIPWNSYSLYQALAVEAHSWTVLWFYCTGSSLTYVYWETTTSPLLNREPMNGTCTSTSTTSAAVSWPAGSMPAPALIAGFSVHGAQIEISGAAPGHATLDGKSWWLYPFATVDCSQICGTPGWYELHSVLRDVDTGETGYGIVYLFTGQTHRVQLAYTLELPAVKRPTDTTFNADWSRN